MAKKKPRVVSQQLIAVGIVAAIAVCALTYLTWQLYKDAPLGEFVEGEHYLLIEEPRRIRDEKLEVMEFFSYACVHCYNLDPELADWVEQQGDKIKFVRMPVVTSDLWRVLGKNYFAMQQLGILEQYHMPFFREIHENRQSFTSVEKLGEYFARYGISAAEYKRAFDSTEVAANTTLADQMARRLKIAAVPGVVIQGKYLVRATGTIGTSRMLEVMDYLIELETAEPMAATP